MSYETKSCKRCNGTGEEYRPELQCNDGPWLDCIGCHGYGFVQSDWSMRHATALLKESYQVGWPRLFKGDVEYHDMRALAERDARLPFVWMLRETGSSIILPDEDISKREIDHCMSVWRVFIKAQDEDCRLYWWDGVKLHRIADKEVLTALLANSATPADEQAA